MGLGASIIEYGEFPFMGLRHRTNDTMKLDHKTVRQTDSAGRIIIGKEFRDKPFAVQLQPDGNILLSPVVVRHEREAWLYENPEAMASVLRGLDQSARGEGRSLGSFAEYAVEPDEDDEEQSDWLTT